MEIKIGSDYEFHSPILTVEGISDIIRFGGLTLLILIVFAETGLLVGFFLPGDSLLVTAGFLAATTDVLGIVPVVVSLSLAAIVGDSTGYYIGKKAGAALYNRHAIAVFQSGVCSPPGNFATNTAGLLLSWPGSCHLPGPLLLLSRASQR